MTVKANPVFYTYQFEILFGSAGIRFSLIVSQWFIFRTPHIKIMQNLKNKIDNLVA